VCVCGVILNAKREWRSACVRVFVFRFIPRGKNSRFSCYLFLTVYFFEILHTTVCAVGFGFAFVLSGVLSVRRWLPLQRLLGRFCIGRGRGQCCDREDLTNDARRSVSRTRKTDAGRRPEKEFCCGTILVWWRVASVSECVCNWRRGVRAHRI
jgi:hypothetical protein